MSMTPEQTRRWLRAQTVEDLLRGLAAALRPYLDLDMCPGPDTFDDLFLEAVSRHNIIQAENFDPSDYDIVTTDDVDYHIDTHLTNNSEFVTLNDVQEWLGGINWNNV